MIMRIAVSTRSSSSFQLKYSSLKYQLYGCIHTARIHAQTYTHTTEVLSKGAQVPLCSIPSQGDSFQLKTMVCKTQNCLVAAFLTLISEPNTPETKYLFFCSGQFSKPKTSTPLKEHASKAPITRDRKSKWKQRLLVVTFHSVSSSIGSLQFLYA